MTKFSATFHGAGKRAGFDILVEVFNPRPGIISQYVNAYSVGDGRVLFHIDRGSPGFQTYVINAETGRRQTPKLEA